jgi:NADPH-dependent 2,4-dienoyl-CoA reductase/sulfur reductase-like enzyme
MGTGPLLYLVAYQYVKAGAKVAAVLDTSPSTFRFEVLRRLAVRPLFAWNGLRMIVALKRAGVKLFHGITPQQIHGDAQEGVTAVRFLDSAGKPHTIECDAVGMGYHLRPETQLADLARCRFQFDQATRQWLPEVDQDGRSSVDNVYLAGDGKAIAGADAAEVSGQLAAYALLQDRGYPVDEEHRQRLYKQRSRLEAFKQGLLAAFPWPARFAAQLPDETVVCRCECITAGELRRTVREMGAQEANRAKALCRVGMGRCQGRFCANAGAEIIAAAANIPVEQVGRLRGQSPVKPLALAVREEQE